MRAVLLLVLLTLSTPALAYRPVVVEDAEQGTRRTYGCTGEQIS